MLANINVQFELIHRFIHVTLNEVFNVIEFSDNFFYFCSISYYLKFLGKQEYDYKLLFQSNKDGF